MGVDMRMKLAAAVWHNCFRIRYDTYTERHALPAEVLAWSRSGIIACVLDSGEVLCLQAEYCHHCLVQAHSTHSYGDL